MVVSTCGGATVTGRIVETEAYLGRDDPASHAYRGRRHAGNLSIYGPAGSWYVYRSYGIHWCANLVTAPPGHGAAVLLRAVTIVAGERTAAQRRGQVPRPRLADGPGKLCQALAIGRGLDGWPMRTSPVLVCPGEVVEDSIVVVTPRIGITRAADWPLRFALSNPRP